MDWVESIVGIPRATSVWGWKTGLQSSGRRAGKDWEFQERQEDKPRERMGNSRKEGRRVQRQGPPTSGSFVPVTRMLLRLDVKGKGLEVPPKVI